MSSEEEPDLPVAAEVTAVGGMADDGAAIQNFVQISEGDELVRKSDAEAAIAKERSRKYDEGFFEGRQSREEKILDKIQEIFTAWRKRTDRLENQENYSGDKELELNKGKAVKNALKELEEEVD
jgi:hypothetical protein